MEKKMKYVLGGIAIIFALILLVLVVPQATGMFGIQTTQETNVVRMGNLPVVHALPVYLAIEKGYFKEAGIDLQLVPLESPSQIIYGIMQNKLDFTSTSGAAGISAVADFKNPGKLKIYALSGGTKNNTNEVLMIPIDSNITSIAELKGKKLGIVGGSIQWKALARYLLEANGLEADKDVTIVEIPIGTHVTAIASKQIDALLTMAPATTTILSKKVGKILVDGPLENTLSDPFYPGAGIINIEFAKKNPNTTAKVISIINKAVKEIEANPTEARKYLPKYTPLSEELATIVPLAMIKTCNEFNEQDIQSLQKFYDLFTKYNIVDKKLNAEGILYCTK